METPNPITVARQTAEQIMLCSGATRPQARDVTLDPIRIEQVAGEIAAKEHKPWGMPKCLEGGMRRDLVRYELLASAVNYCYFYGTPDCRPNDAGSTKMYALLDEAFVWARNQQRGAEKRFADLLIAHRFPLCEDRARHIRAVSHARDKVAALTNMTDAGRDFPIAQTVGVVLTIPGFGGDIFIKRASLFLMMLYRRYGWMADTIGELVVPADYQVPRILRKLGCITYSERLAAMIERNDELAAGSRLEVEIRAATIVACDRLAAAAKVNTSRVDEFLWLRRKEVADPYHITVTTAY
jgi:hypothetical protein